MASKAPKFLKKEAASKFPAKKPGISGDTPKGRKALLPPKKRK